MLDDEFLSQKELSLVYESVDFYNRRALEGAVPEIARIVTYKMAKTLAMRLRYPADAEEAFILVRRVADWLARHSVSLAGEDRVSLVSFYLERLVFNLARDVRALVSSDPRFRGCFGTWEAVRSFVISACGQGGAGNGK